MEGATGLRRTRLGTLVIFGLHGCSCARVQGGADRHSQRHRLLAFVWPWAGESILLGECGGGGGDGHGTRLWRMGMDHVGRTDRWPDGVLAGGRR